MRGNASSGERVGNWHSPVSRLRSLLLQDAALGPGQLEAPDERPLRVPRLAVRRARTLGVWPRMPRTDR